MHTEENTFENQCREMVTVNTRRKSATGLLEALLV